VRRFQLTLTFDYQAGVNTLIFKSLEQDVAITADAQTTAEENYKNEETTSFLAAEEAVTAPFNYS
jgi:hypothetical protein